MNVGCVLIAYNPNKELLRLSLNVLKSEVDEIYMGDNSIISNQNWINSLIECYDYKIKYEYFGNNLGIAKAQNFGINYFLEHKFDFILFMDQDSILERGSVNILINDYKKIEAKGYKVGGIGPRPFNRDENKEYRGSVVKGKKITHELTKVSEIISSSSLIPINVFKDVGFMEEDLFIDGVDHEFCWRANYLKRYNFFISERINLSHKLGEGDRHFLIRKVAVPTPFRTFYQFRNYFFLIRRNYVPLYWKLSNGFKYFIKMFYYPIFIKPRYGYMINISRGIYCGILKKKK